MAMKENCVEETNLQEEITENVLISKDIATGSEEGISKNNDDPNNADFEACVDTGLGSSLCGEHSGSLEDHGTSSNCSDSGRGSEVDDPFLSNSVMAYHLYIPHNVCGRLIGIKGSYIKYLKTETKCQIILQEIFVNKQYNSKTFKTNGKFNSSIWPQLCLIEGTRRGIEKCLDILSSRFPLLSLDQVNVPIGSIIPAEQEIIPVLNAKSNVSVCSIVSLTHIFIHSTDHQSYSSLSRLDECINNYYEKNQSPFILSPITVGTICVALAGDRWYRAQVLHYDKFIDICDIKFLDYGGYLSLPTDNLRQIRSDYLSFPFQAIECYLANVLPIESDLSIDPCTVLDKLTSDQELVVEPLCYAEDDIPLIHLFNKANANMCINRELVAKGLAEWVELNSPEYENQLEN